MKAKTLSPQAQWYKENGGFEFRSREDRAIARFESAIILAFFAALAFLVGVFA